MYQQQYNARMKSLEADVNAAYGDFKSGRITEKRFNDVMSKAEAEQEKLNTAIATRARALSYGDSGASSMGNWRSQFKNVPHGGDGPWCGFSKQLNAGNMHERERWPFGSRQISRLPSAYDMDDADLQKLAGAFNAREQCSVRVKAGDFTSRAVSKDFTASPIAEGIPTFTGLLPPVLLPDAPVFYIYDNEPRLLDFVPSIAIETEEVALPVEQYPTNPGAVSFIEEAGSFADIGSSWESVVFRPTKIGALGSITTEAAEDAPYLTSYLPKTIQELITQEENVQFLYGNGDGPNLRGLANIDNIQQFALAALQYDETDNDLDAVRAASFILRETPNVRSFADLIIMSPTTWFGLSSLKDTQGRYLINIASPVTEIPTLQTLWDIPVVLSTNVEIGDIFVMAAAKSLRVILRKGLETMVNPGYSDTYFQTGLIGYRCEERLTVGAIRPAGIVYLTSSIVS